MRITYPFRYPELSLHLGGTSMHVLHQGVAVASIQCTGKIVTDPFGSSKVSHMDLLVHGDIHVLPLKNIRRKTAKQSHLFIPVAAIEFLPRSNSIYVYSMKGDTIIRIQCTGLVRKGSSVLSEFGMNLDVEGDINVCLSFEAVKTIVD